MDEDLSVEREIEAHDGRNQELRQLLVAKGVELSVPRRIECHFWVKDQEHAAALARRLYIKGFLVLVISPCEDDVWNVEAATDMAPTDALSRPFSEEMVRLAASHAAEYDGWGTQL